MIPRIPVDDEDDEGGGGVPLWRRPRFILVAAIAVVVVIYVFTHGSEPQKHNGAQKSSDTFIGEVAAYQPPARIVTTAHAEDIPEPPEPPPAPTHSAPSPQNQAPPAAEDRPPAAPPWPDPRSLVPHGTSSAPPRTRMLVYAVPPPAAPAAPPAPPPETGLDFKTSSIPGLKASAAIDDTYQLMPGLLPLILDTAINSDVPGSILAHLPGPVYSRKGVLLMPAGTQVIGKYESMGKGSRLMANSVYAFTPSTATKGAVWVPLTGQNMTDNLGRSGLDGEIDRHLMERFGAAVLLDLVGQGLQIVQAEASKGGNTYLNFNSSGGTSSLASQILQSQINIPATFSKHQGEMVALFVDEPVDFSASYRIHPAGGQ